MSLFNKHKTMDNKGIELIENVKKAIKLDKSNPSRNSKIEETMNAMYDYFATYSEEELGKHNIQLEIYNVEKLLENEFLSINTEPIYDENYKVVLPKKIKTKEDAEKLLDCIVYYARRNLSKSFDIKNASLAKQCICTSYNVEEICSDIEIETIHIGVNQRLENGMYHHFTIVKVPMENKTYKNYLVDCTYRQFFTKNNSNPRRIGIMIGPIRGASIGSYMIKTERRKEIAECILTKGYIEVTPEVIKEYLDAIVYSGRDKDYYEEHGLDYMNPEDIIPKYTAEDYINLIIKNKAAIGTSMDIAVDEIMGSNNVLLSEEDIRKVNFVHLFKTKNREEK